MNKIIGEIEKASDFYKLEKYHIFYSLEKICIVLVTFYALNPSFFAALYASGKVREKKIKQKKFNTIEEIEAEFSEHEICVVNNNQIEYIKMGKILNRNFLQIQCNVALPYFSPFSKSRRFYFKENEITKVEKIVKLMEK